MTAAGSWERFFEGVCVLRDPVAVRAIFVGRSESGVSVLARRLLELDAPPLRVVAGMA